MRDPEKRRESQRQSRLRHPETQRRCDLRRLYGLTIETYKQMLEQQHYVCAICKRGETLGNLVVDHEHESGSVRALLCHACNLGLGKFDDDPELLERAAQYVRNREGQPHRRR